MILVCCGTGCVAQGAMEVLKKFQQLSSVGIAVKMTGCYGFCERGPLVVIRKNGKSVFYQNVKAEGVERIITRTIGKGEILDDLLYEDPQTKKKIIEEKELPFYKHQKRLILENNGKIDPTNIDDYLKLGGYKSAEKALKMEPEEIIEEIKKSGLRGRGGAGFPTGRKWESCRREKEKVKYIICNGDEGDPGAFMDSGILEGNPQLVIEGMIIGSFAIGVERAFIYVRAEYPLAVKRLEIALNQAREKGFLGKNIFGSGFNFDIEIVQGAGAFVCGEETALIQSIEGKIGEPYPRPPYPAEKGVFGKPTLINNVKTWAAVPLIVKNGSGWFSSIGTETSKGTMIFSLVGKVKNTGLIEVPMGITLRDLIFKIGGGIIGDKKFKAVQTGGPSGGCIPEKYLDLPVDYEALARAGSIMGSGGMVVMDEDTCMVSVARYFLAFTREESCGKCVPCREGTYLMLKILDKFVGGIATEDDLKELEETALMVKDTSFCGLGKTAPNPVLTTLRYFRDEYMAHIGGKCPAGVCRDLIKYEIDEQNCTGCTVCVKNCPQNAIEGERKKPHKIIQEKCIKCGICEDVCKFDAVKKK